MSTIPINLAIEDELSEAVLRRVLKHLKRGYSVGVAYRRGGYGYLRRTIAGWNNAAKGIPFVVLTDLDKHDCPRSLIEEWLRAPQHPNLVFRVAVREVEAWLLADRRNLSSRLGIRERIVPSDVDALHDPKAALIQLAKRSRFKHVRNGVAPKSGSTASQGPVYNSFLAAFVSEIWDVSVAATGSPSLARTLEKLARFEPVW